jgi:hypothetical protein
MVFPESWKEFKLWNKTNGDHDITWGEGVLAKSFELPWGRHIEEVSESEQIVTAVSAKSQESARMVTNHLREELRRLAYIRACSEEPGSPKGDTP